MQHRNVNSPIEMLWTHVAFAIAFAFTIAVCERALSLNTLLYSSAYLFIERITVKRLGVSFQIQIPEDTDNSTYKVDIRVTETPFS